MQHNASVTVSVTCERRVVKLQVADSALVVVRVLVLHSSPLIFEQKRECCMIKCLSEYSLQGLSDTEEFVVCKALNALTCLAELGLLQKPTLQELVSEIVPFLCHPVSPHNMFCLL